MKSKVLVLFGLISILVASSASAVTSTALPIRRDLNKSPIFTWQYAQLVGSLVKSMQGVQVNNTGIHPVMLAFGGSGNEVQQMLVGGNQDTGFLPLGSGYATRLSVIALDGPNETGDLDVNIFYN